MRLTVSSHSVKSAAGTSSPSSLHTTAEKLDFSSISGASYNMGSVLFSMTQSGLTLQNMEIFWKIASSSGSSQRSTIISG